MAKKRVKTVAPVKQSRLWGYIAGIIVLVFVSISSYSVGKVVSSMETTKWVANVISLVEKTNRAAERAYGMGVEEGKKIGYKQGYDAAIQARKVLKAKRK